MYIGISDIGINQYFFSSDDENTADTSATGVLDPRTGKIKTKAGPNAAFKREPHVPTQMDVEETATIEYLRSLKLIRRVAPGE